MPGPAADLAEGQGDAAGGSGKADTIDGVRLAVRNEVLPLVARLACTWQLSKSSKLL